MHASSHIAPYVCFGDEVAEISSHPIYMSIDCVIVRQIEDADERIPSTFLWRVRQV